MARRSPIRLLLSICCLGLLFSASVHAGKNLNTAPAEQLQQVPGIASVTVEKILKMRKHNGPFHSVDDLRTIRGLGPKRLEKMRKYLAVGNALQLNPRLRRSVHLP